MTRSWEGPATITWTGPRAPTSVTEGLAGIDWFIARFANSRREPVADAAHRVPIANVRERDDL